MKDAGGAWGAKMALFKTASAQLGTANDLRKMATRLLPHCETS